MTKLEKSADIVLAFGSAFGVVGILFKLKILLYFVFLCFALQFVIRLINIALYKEVHLRGEKFAGKNLYIGVIVILFFLIISIFAISVIERIFPLF